MDRSRLDELNRRTSGDYARMMDEMSAGATPGPVRPGRAPDGFCYVRAVRLARRWQTDEKPVWELMSSLFVGLYNMGAAVSVLLEARDGRLGVYMGVGEEHIDMLIGMLRGVFPQIRFESFAGRSVRVFSYREAVPARLPAGGFIKGDPTGGDSFTNLYQMDSVVKGMTGKNWRVAIFAEPVPKRETLRRQQQWLAAATRCSQLAQITISGSDNMDEVSYGQQYYESAQYIKKVDAFCQHSAESVAVGEWCAAVNFQAENSTDARLLGGLLTAAFYGEASEPEPVHAVLRNGDASEPLVDGMEERFCHFQFLERMPFPRYANLLSSRQLAVYAAFPTVETAGIAVSDYVQFDVDRSAAGDLVIGSILDGDAVTANPYAIAADELGRHCLVVGLTGSGKTNTVKSLICGMTAGGRRPLMVIEPAKKEYWELYKLGFDRLQIYSVGSGEPGAHTFCLNPFQRVSCTGPDGVRRAVPIQTHIDFVYAAFKASFIMYTPMPYVLERAIYAIYEDCGWDIHKNINTRGEEIWPTIEDLYFKIPQVVTAMGYDQKMRSDLIGSLQARVNSMRLGSKGDTLNVECSFPFDRLLEGDVVVELEDIGDDDVKAFIISLLLVDLLEYRRQQEDSQLQVRHLMLIEEAHRLLKNVQSGTGENADPRGAAVEFFCNLLAELRSKGQGFVVADQIPSKLAPDLVKNTNLKIVHRTVAAEERELIGGAMHMTPEQIDSLASLRQGVAAVYSEGDERPKLVRSRYAGTYMHPDRADMRREQVLAAVAPNCIRAEGQREYQSLTDARTEICRRCDAHCRKRYTDILDKFSDLERFCRQADMLDPNKLRSCRADKIDQFIRQALREQVTDPAEDLDRARYCLLNCLIERWALDGAVKDKLSRVYMEKL